MKQYQESSRVETEGQGLTEITQRVARVVEAAQIQMGLCTVFIRHTSASLLIQENADPTAAADLEAYMARLAPENDPAYTHTFEGSDDMPAHLRAALTSTSEQIPVNNGKLLLGTWQGVFLFEHRRGRHQREVVVHVLGE